MQTIDRGAARALAAFALLAAACLCGPETAQAAAADEEAPAPSRQVALDLGGGVQMELVLIPAGSFVMGDNGGLGDEKPAHKVTITAPFYLGKYEVTQEQWEAVMGNNPSYFKGPQNPVETVTWEDCQAFLRGLNVRAATGAKFSLPTEAQWEYACRAGATTRFNSGDTEAGLSGCAWYNGPGSGCDDSTQPVGLKKPNAWGLYDMHGNVWEWCADWYDPDYYRHSPAADPTGPASGTVHVLRGGSWGDYAFLCRSARRFLPTAYRNINYGFGLRVAAAVPRGGLSLLPARPRYEVRSPGMTVKLTADGTLAGVVLGGRKLQRHVTGGTWLAGCRVQGEVSARKLDGGGVEFTRRLISQDPPRQCTQVDRFLPAAHSVRWEIEIRGPGGPWTTPVVTRLRYPAAPSRVFWTAWSDPEHRSDGWRDPLVFRPFTKNTWSYGNTVNMPTRGDFITMPLATAAEPAADAALSVILSPEDTLLEMSLSTDESGGVAFSRTRHRLGENRPVRFALDLVAHAADWRGGLGWLVARYPKFFNPAVPLADEMAGCGAYTGNEAPIDAAKLRGMAFRVSWKLSDDNPWTGMFLPPWEDPDKHWERACDASAPANEPRSTSFRRLNDYGKYMRRQGFYVLNYFNVCEYGAKMLDRPVPLQEAAKDPDLWQKPLEFLKVRLPNACLQPLVRVGNYGWLVDVGDPGYQQHILEQAKRHIEKLPDTSGICIDRMDWLRFYNLHADDGVSWVDGRPARSLFQSWLQCSAKLGPMMHDAGKVIFVNNHVKRLELLRDVDGTYCEHCFWGTALNATGLLSLRRPAIGWTGIWNVGERGCLWPDPDAFFQRHLHLGVFPTAPYFGNDHCIAPSPWADEQYLDYGPLLDAVRGRKWVLLPHVVTAPGNQAKVNLFEVPGGYALPVTFAGKATSVRIVLRGIEGLTERTICEALHPGREKGQPVSLKRNNAEALLDVPVKRGCAMVRIFKSPETDRR